MSNTRIWKMSKRSTQILRVCDPRYGPHKARTLPGHVQVQRQYSLVDPNIDAWLWSCLSILKGKVALLKGKLPFCHFSYLYLTFGYLWTSLSIPLWQESFDPHHNLRSIHDSCRKKWISREISCLKLSLSQLSCTLYNHGFGVHRELIVGVCRVHF